MSIVKHNLIGASGQGGYFIDRSLRFRSSASAYLSTGLQQAPVIKQLGLGVLG